MLCALPSANRRPRQTPSGRNRMRWVIAFIEGPGGKSASGMGHSARRKPRRVLAAKASSRIPSRSNRNLSYLMRLAARRRNRGTPGEPRKPCAISCRFACPWVRGKFGAMAGPPHPPPLSTPAAEALRGLFEAAAQADAGSTRKWRQADNASAAKKCALREAWPDQQRPLSRAAPHGNVGVTGRAPDRKGNGRSSDQ